MRTFDEYLWTVTGYFHESHELPQLREDYEEDRATFLAELVASVSR